MLNYNDHYSDLAIFSLVWASITIQSGFYTHEWTFILYILCLILFYGRFYFSLPFSGIFYFSFHIKSTHMWMLENKATYKNNNMYAMLNGN